MGNYKFRLSDMMPNAWFYKLRDMSLTTNSTRNPNSKKKPTKSTKTYSLKSHNSSSHPNQPRQSYYYSSDFSTVSKATSFDEPPRRSASKQSRRGTRRKTVYKPSPRRTPPSSADQHHCSCENHHQVLHHHHQHDLDFMRSPVSSEFESDVFDYANDESQNGQASRRSSSCSCGFSSSATDIIIDVESRSYGFDAMLELDLPPILTKPASQQTKTVSPSSVQKDRETASIPKETATRKSVSSGIKLRPKSNSPKIQPNSSRRKSISRRSKAEAQKKAGFSESFAIVKASVDPEKDFRESMMEMIVENNIRASKDLEELLACYLSLNSDEYHGLIIKAFEQIWFNLPDLKA